MNSEKDSYGIKISKNAPLIPKGAAIGKESMVYSFSNSMIDIAPFINISDAARTFYTYMTTIILDETHNALDGGTYSFSEKSRRFFFNIREFLSFSDKVGKKHYTFSDIRKASEELVGQPLTFVRTDGEAFSTVAFFSEIFVDIATGDCYFDVAASLLAHYVPELSAKKEQHLISLIESFKFSNSYTDALYRLINGYIQTVDLIKDYSVPITVLKQKMGLTTEHCFWNNKFFISRILNKSVEMINNVSDISFDYKIIKYEKQNRIKDIVFVNIKRKGTEENAASKADVTPTTVESGGSNITNTADTETTGRTEDFSETEIILARILSLCMQEGFDVDQSMQIYVQYKNNFNKLRAVMEMFHASLRYGLKSEADKYDFVMRPDI